MLTITFLFYSIMFIISRYNFFWPLTLLIRGGIGDKAIAVVWIIMLISLFA